MAKLVCIIGFVCVFVGCGAADPPAEVAAALSGPAITATAPSSSDWGPHTASHAEYKFAPVIDTELLPHSKTELWGRVHYPANLIESAAKDRLPLIVFLHGNHATCGTGSNPREDFDCTYTNDGVCPSQHVVVHNHIGYDYLAERLASHGYLVVSINANRGITCGGSLEGDNGLNLARGRLILRHLQLLSRWSQGAERCKTLATTPEATSAGVPTYVSPSGLVPDCSPLPIKLTDRIDFLQVGLMGHSRGGEGARAALHQYYEPTSPWPARIGAPVWMRAIYEIGAVDGQTDLVLDAQNVAWNQLLPMCDGDVRFLDGIAPFDRMLEYNEVLPRNKSYQLVYGANHNYFNSEWQMTDSPGCGSEGHVPLFTWTDIGSPEQRAVAISSVLAFFRSHLGQKKAKLRQQFNPLYRMPEEVSAITRVDRAFIDTTRAEVVPRVDDFSEANNSVSGLPRVVSGITFEIDPITNPAFWRHDLHHFAAISWADASAANFLETHFRPAGQGLDITEMKTLDFRVARDVSVIDSAPTSFSVSLIHGDNRVSTSVDVADYVVIDGPGTGPLGPHQTLWTVRVPFADFPGADLTDVRGVRFTFDRSASGAIALADIRASRVGADMRLPAALAMLASTAAPQPTDQSRASQKARRKPLTPTVSVAGSVDAITQSPTHTRITIKSASGKFAVTDSLAQLEVGQRRFSRSTASADRTRLTFVLSSADYAKLKSGDMLKAVVGSKAYQLGPLVK